MESVGVDDTTGLSSPCSGPVCLDGDLGVYCQCYFPKRSPWREVKHHGITPIPTLVFFMADTRLMLASSTSLQFVTAATTFSV